MGRLVLLGTLLSGRPNRMVIPIGLIRHSMDVEVGAFKVQHRAAIPSDPPGERGALGGQRGHLDLVDETSVIAVTH